MNEKAADAFRTISEVAEWLEVNPHVLRFWESKFTQIKPVKRAGGRRYYRPADLALLSGIQKLLHEDGMTIKGVQKILREQGVRAVAAMAKPLEVSTDAPTSPEPASTVSGQHPAARPSPASPVAQAPEKASPATHPAPARAPVHTQAPTTPPAQTVSPLPPTTPPQTDPETRPNDPGATPTPGAAESPSFQAPPASRDRPAPDPAAIAPRAAAAATPTPPSESATRATTAPGATAAAVPGAPLFIHRSLRAGAAAPDPTPSSASPVAPVAASADTPVAPTAPPSAPPPMRRPLPDARLTVQQALEALEPGQIPPEALRPFLDQLRALHTRMDSQA
jgi:DNA-binding transcriptional MerR regulator